MTGHTQAQLDLGRTLNVVRGGTCPWCRVNPTAMAVHVDVARWTCCGHTMPLPPLADQRPGWQARRDAHRARINRAA
jgi:hypothetical protein